ncbi:hypothetical protein MLD38_006764 [Melastoma candidum]|nr:hypothetical protein MLD38_006764 [Melastoma candidum]
MYAEKKPDKVDPNEQRLSKWLNCALSGEPLTEPCVIDGLGNVFNKEALVRALLERNLPKEFGYIRGLKDMLGIELSRSSGDGDVRFQCPITGLEFNGKYRFYALRGCGHVLSAKALKEVKSSACLVCHGDFKEEDKIPINGSEEEVKVLRQRLEEERAKAKENKLKKAKNTKNGEEPVGLSTGKRVGSDGGDANVENGAGGGKRFKAADAMPKNATKEVYASIFTSSKKKTGLRETFTCRSLPLGRN